MKSFSCNTYSYIYFDSVLITDASNEYWEKWSDTHDLHYLQRGLVNVDFQTRNLIFQFRRIATARK